MAGHNQPYHDFLAEPTQAAASASRSVALITGIFAVILGAMVGLFGGLLSLVGVLAIISLGAILSNWRIGVWLAVFLLPFSATHLLPRQALDITGLNPFNIVVLATLLGLAGALLSQRSARLLPRLPRIFEIYLVLILAGAVHGSFFAHLAPLQLDPSGTWIVLTRTKYLLDNLAKPMIIILVMVLAAMMVRSGHGRSLIWAMASAVVLFGTIVLGYLVITGTTLQVLASSRARGFLSWMGMHANELGLLANISFALMLCTALRARRGEGRGLLFIAAGIAAGTAALTFSRGAFLGILVVSSYFLVSRKRMKELLAGLLILTMVALTLPEAFLERATIGLERGDVQQVTAGRLDQIWRPLLPTVMGAPVFGHGLSSTLWAEPNRAGTMVRVGHPHSAYLGVLLDFGILGVVVITVFFWSMWRLFAGLRRDHPEPYWQGVFEGGSVCILVLIVQGLTDDRFVPTFAQCFLWVAYGLALGHAAQLEHSGRHTANARAGLP